MKERPCIVIASSSEQIGTATRIADALGRSSEWSVLVWDRLFDFSASYVESLENVLDRADFAVVVLTGDDTAIVREKVAVLPRDNVIFELGLFIGRLGRPRCFFFVDAETGTQIASDLSGVKAVSYYPDSVAPADPRRPRLADQVQRMKAQLREFGAAAVRFRPSPELRRRQEELWRFSSQVAGQWWERMRSHDDDQSALSHVTVTMDPVTCEPRLDGVGYSLDASVRTEWHSVITGVTFGDMPKIYYAWEGRHLDNVGQEYGGHGVVSLVDPQLQEAEGYFFDTNFARIAEGAHTVVKRFRLSRASPGDVAIMRHPYAPEARQLVRQQLRNLRWGDGGTKAEAEPAPEGPQGPPAA
jgi:hypothetical protein